MNDDREQSTDAGADGRCAVKSLCVCVCVSVCVWSQSQQPVMRRDEDDVENADVWRSPTLMRRVVVSPLLTTPTTPPPSARLPRRRNIMVDK